MSALDDALRPCRPCPMCSDPNPYDIKTGWVEERVTVDECCTCEWETTNYVEIDDSGEVCGEPECICEDITEEEFDKYFLNGDLGCPHYKEKQEIIDNMIDRAITNGLQDTLEAILGACRKVAKEYVNREEERNEKR